MPSDRGFGTFIGPGSPCPCGLRSTYDACCGRFHAGGDAPTAELLMRSRYSAFAIGDADYLVRTWHPAARPAQLVLDPDQEWLGLEVLATTGGSMFATEGTVEFVARYRRGRDEGLLHELSAFTRHDGRWRYAGEAGTRE